MYRFEPIIYDVIRQQLRNVEYLDDILQLYWQYKDDLTDDYSNKGFLLPMLLEEIRLAEGNFQAIITPENKFMGCVYMLRFEGVFGNYHSLQIQGFIKREFWGKPVETAYKQLLELLFSHKEEKTHMFRNLSRVQMEIPEINTRACSLAERLGFKLDGIIRNASHKNGLDINHKLYSILRGEI